MKEWQRAAVGDLRADVRAAYAAFGTSIKRAFEKCTSVLQAEQGDLALGADPPAPRYPEEFEEVWKAWLYWGRARGTKHGGYKVWRGLAPPPAVTATISGIEAWGLHWKTEGTRDAHIPHFEKFAASRSWESPPYDKRKPAASLAPMAVDTEAAMKRQREAEERAEASWRSEWVKRWPEKTYPGRNAAMAAIMQADKEGAA